MTAPKVRVGDVLQLERLPIEPQPAEEYVSIGVRSFGKGIFHYERMVGSQLGKLRFFKVQPGRLVISNIKRWEGAVALSSEVDAGCIASNRFLTYLPRDERIDINWARWYFLSEPGNELLQRASPGSADRNRTLAIERFENLEIPLPPLEDQRRTAELLRSLEAGTRAVAGLTNHSDELVRALVTTSVRLGSVVSDRENRDAWPTVALREVLAPIARSTVVESDREYRIAGVFSFGKGVINRGTISGSQTSYKSLFRLEPGDVVFSKLGAWEGAVAVVPDEYSGFHVSSEFPVLQIDRTNLLPEFMEAVIRSPAFWASLSDNTFGSMARRRRIQVEDFLDRQILLPGMNQQAEVAAILGVVKRIERSRARSKTIATSILSAAVNAAYSRD